MANVDAGGGLPLTMLAAGVASRGRGGFLAPLLCAVAVAVAVNLPYVARLAPSLATSAAPLLELVANRWITAAGNVAAGALAVLALVRMVTGGDPRLRMARRLERRGDLVGAAELHSERGDSERALDLFLRGRAWSRAADEARDLGRFREAAEALRRAGGRRLSDAARLFRRAGDTAAAQRCDGDLAQWLMSTGRTDEAVEAWLRAGQPRQAVRAAQVALSERRLAPSQSSFLAARRAAASLRAHDVLALLHEVESDWGSAARAWQRAGDHRRAAACFRRAGRLAEAAEEEAVAGRPAEAAQLRLRRLRSLLDRLRSAETGGMEAVADLAALRRQVEHETEALLPRLIELGMTDAAVEVLSGSGRVEEALELLVRSGHETAAAEVARNAQRWDLAAPILERLGRWGEASDIHELAGDLAAAGRCAQRAGEDERALQMFRSAGLAEDAAHALARLGFLQDGITELHRSDRLDAAHRLLRSFPGPVPDIPDVMLDLAGWLRESRSVAEAVACLQRAVLAVALQPHRLDPAVALARLLHEAGDDDAALQQVERVLEFDYSHRPAQELRREILAARPPRDGAMTLATPAAADGAPSPPVTGALRYEILHELGRGGMGVVYRARDTRLERDVAIKVLRTTSPEEAARLEQEAKAAATLNHPGIVVVYDFEAGFDGYFIAMEYVPGQPLDSLIRTEPATVAANLRPILVRLADAVAYAHRRGVIHRDLKPGNILVTPALDVKVLDFGIAARLDRAGAESPSVCGTPFYMAPEQIRGEAPTPATDIYAFGTTAYHLATGRPPFSRGNVIEAHLTQEPIDPRVLTPDLDPEIAEAILRCLAKEPGARFETAEDLREVLAAPPR